MTERTTVIRVQWDDHDAFERGPDWGYVIRMGGIDADEADEIAANDGWITEPPGPEIDDTAEVWVTYKPGTEPNGAPVRPEFAKWAREWWNDGSGDCDVVAWQPRPIVPAPYIPEETRATKPGEEVGRGQITSTFRETK